jgi:hypothetical protein
MIFFNLHFNPKFSSMTSFYLVVWFTMLCSNNVFQNHGNFGADQNYGIIITIIKYSIIKSWF